MLQVQKKFGLFYIFELSKVKPRPQFREKIFNVIKLNAMMPCGQSPNPMVNKVFNAI